MRALGLGVVCTLALLGCREPNTFQPPPPPQVTTAKPVARTITPTTEIVGRTAPLVSVDIRARVRGYLKTIEFDEGAFVNEGDLLFTIEREHYEATLAAARASEAEANARASQTTSELERLEELLQRDVATEKEMFDARADKERAAAAVLVAQAQVRQAELDLSYTEIHSPISGKINKASVDIGNLVGHNEPTLLTTVVTWDPIAVYFNASERDVLDFRRKQSGAREKPEETTVSLDLSDGTRYEHEGVIDYADNRVDPQTGTLRIRAVFPNPQLRLVPGVFARVHVPAEPLDTLLVPETCLQRDLAGHYLMVVGSDKKAARLDVEIGPTEGNMRAITSGLTADQDVIIRGLQRVRPGGPVTPQTAEEAAAQPTSQPAQGGN